MQQLLEDKNFAQGEMIDFARYIKVLKRSFLSILFFATLFAVITAVVVLSITPKYTATATLLIEAQEKKVVSIQEVVGIDTSQAEYYLTQFESLKSNQLAEKVIRDLKIDELVEFNTALDTEKGIIDKIKEMPFVASLLNNKQEDTPSKEMIRQKVLKAFKENLVIFPVRKTQLVRISFTSEDPELAAKVANAVGSAYIESNLEGRISITKHASSWISSRLIELKGQLEESEKALSDFLVKEQLIDDSGIDVLASKELDNLTERIAELRDKRIETASTYDALRSSNVTDVSSLTAIPSISKHPQVIAIREAEILAENNVNELSKRYGPKHDKMKAAQAKLDAVQLQAKNTTEKLINGIGKELQAIRKQEALINQEISTRKGEFQSLTVKKSKYEALKREVETNRNVLNVFLSREKETEATSDFGASNAKIADKALVPLEPSAPKKTAIVVIAFVVSAGLAIVMVLMIELLKNTIESVKDFENRFGMIPLGCIPQIKAKRFKKRPLDHTVLFDEQEFGFSESIRSIRTSLTLSYMHSDRKRLAITSSLPSEGKSTVALNLAMCMAKMENTLLIDCDLRKSAIAGRFGLKKRQQGLVDHLMKGLPLQQCLLKDEQSGLYILPAGMATANPQELLSSKQFENLLDELDELFDCIIIDTPPTLPVSDSLIIGQNADSVLLVVKANSTKLDTVKMSMGILMSHNIVVDGVIVNQLDPNVSKSEYGYGYGASEYGDHGDEINAINT
ncbi:polysaccharide biosynthesis tyrosine autokinase [Vibrio sp. JC009]|uniref:GumC family protein n=1 Tax=Vibrio sp. JC009 TaxID=2912314 RepID=UPI0023AF8CAB|nr:polysaccharide biosynthesis tyrosine autokinase [Vibrio sp. JC009]WED20646.1 polysaccharide biosynthesis tyrosine autokinase [Vibrio sp. JC009]